MVREAGYGAGGNRFVCKGLENSVSPAVNGYLLFEPQKDKAAKGEE